MPTDGCAGQFLMTTFGILIAFAVGVWLGCATAAIALAGWERHLPRGRSDHLR